MWGKDKKSSQEILSIRLVDNKPAIKIDASLSENLMGQTEFAKLGYLLADVTKAAVNSFRTSKNRARFENLTNEQIEKKIVEAFLDEMCLDI